MAIITKGSRRYRYIQFHIVTVNTHLFQSSDLIRSVRQHQENNISKEMGNGFKFWLIQFDGTSGIMKCPSQGKDQMIRSLQSLHVVDGTSLNIVTTGTSGTIRGLKTRKKR